MLRSPWLKINVRWNVQFVDKIFFSFHISRILTKDKVIIILFTLTNNLFLRWNTVGSSLKKVTAIYIGEYRAGVCVCRLPKARNNVAESLWARLHNWAHFVNRRRGLVRDLLVGGGGGVHSWPLPPLISHIRILPAYATGDVTGKQKSEHYIQYYLGSQHDG